MDTEEPVNAQEIQTVFREFAVVATEFCKVVDSAPPIIDRVVFLSKIYEILPRLIHQGVSLPALPCSEQDTNKELARSRMKEAEWGQLYESLKERLGDWDLYWQVFDPTTDSEAIRGSLADDLADIYRDVKKGIDHKNLGSASQQDTIFTWRVLFYSHWGQHGMNALYTIHFRLQDSLA